MTGVILISRDGFYADLDGKVDWGPLSDKVWLLEFIKDKTVFVGYKTWETIKRYDALINSAYKWVVGELTEPCDVHFGGPASFKKFLPDYLIVHRTRTNLIEGLKFKCTCRKTLLSVKELEDYTEIHYVFKK